MKATLFDRTYKGPRGPHLSYRTHMTIKGERKEGGTSIHPAKCAAGRSVRHTEK